MVCTFFGHRDCPDTVRVKLFDAIQTEILRGATMFYVGNSGKFDAMVLSCLRALKAEYKKICYAVVLAYLPACPSAHPYLPEETVYPEGIKNVPKHFAIDFRNLWMIRRADTVISYTTHAWGGAAKYVQKAKSKGATIINLVADEKQERN